MNPRAETPIIPEAPMANAIDDVKPVAWQRRLKFDTRNMNLPGRWEQCPGEEATGHFERRAGYEYRSLYASPAPSQHTGWSDEAVEALKALHHAVCGETGFAAAVRLTSGLAYPWPSLDAADELARAALSAASSIAPATGFEVKALEWVKHPDADLWRADSIVGEYSVSAIVGCRWQFVPYDGSSWVKGKSDIVEDAFAACFADLNTRIRSSISPSVAKESGEP